MYVIEIRQVAESITGLVSKGGKVLKFDDESKARIFGKENIEKSRYIACWEAITENTAKIRGHEI
nr:hypothetical protein [uncultured archaeon]